MPARSRTASSLDEKKNPPRIFSKMGKNRNLWDDETNTKLKKVLFLFFEKFETPHPSPCWRAILQPGRSYWVGRLSTVDLLVLTYLDQLVFILKTSFSFFTKQASLRRRSTVLSLLPQLVFPAPIHFFICWLPLLKDLSYLTLNPCVVSHDKTPH